MNGTSRLRCWWLACLCLGLMLTSGCQTWTGGMTLPSGHYLEHPPQYFPPSPPFPLTRELAAQEAVAAAPAPGAGGVGVLPPPVPVPPVGGPPMGVPPVGGPPAPPG